MLRATNAQEKMSPGLVFSLGTLRVYRYYQADCVVRVFAFRVPLIHLRLLCCKKRALYCNKLARYFTATLQFNGTIVRIAVLVIRTVVSSHDSYSSRAALLGWEPVDGDALSTPCPFSRRLLLGQEGRAA